MVVKNYYPPLFFQQKLLKWSIGWVKPTTFIFLSLSILVLGGERVLGESAKRPLASQLRQEGLIHSYQVYESNGWYDEYELHFGSVHFLDVLTDQKQDTETLISLIKKVHFLLPSSQWYVRQFDDKFIIDGYDQIKKVWVKIAVAPKEMKIHRKAEGSHEGLIEELALPPHDQVVDGTFAQGIVKSSSERSMPQLLERPADEIKVKGGWRVAVALLRAEYIAGSWGSSELLIKRELGIANNLKSKVSLFNPISKAWADSTICSYKDFKCFQKLLMSTNIETLSAQSPTEGEITFVPSSRTNQALQTAVDQLSHNGLNGKGSVVAGLAIAAATELVDLGADELLKKWGGEAELDPQERALLESFSLERLRGVIKEVERARNGFSLLASFQNVADSQFNGDLKKTFDYFSKLEKKNKKIQDKNLSLLKSLPPQGNDNVRNQCVDNLIVSGKNMQMSQSLQSLLKQFRNSKQLCSALLTEYQSWLQVENQFSQLRNVVLSHSELYYRDVLNDVKNTRSSLKTARSEAQKIPETAGGMCREMVASSLELLKKEAKEAHETLFKKCYEFYFVPPSSDEPMDRIRGCIGNCPAYNQLITAEMQTKEKCIEMLSHAAENREALIQAKMEIAKIEVVEKYQQAALRRGQKCEKVEKQAVKIAAGSDRWFVSQDVLNKKLEANQKFFKYLLKDYREQRDGNFQNQVEAMINHCRGEGSASITKTKPLDGKNSYGMDSRGCVNSAQCIQGAFNTFSSLPSSSSLPSTPPSSLGATLPTTSETKSTFFSSPPPTAPKNSLMCFGTECSSRD